MGNIAQQLQHTIAEALDTQLSGFAMHFIAEDSLDVGYEAQAALNKTGAVCIVATPQLEYIGHNQQGPAYDATVELQFAENAPVHRAQLKHQSLEDGTALDVALSAQAIAADVAGKSFGRLCPGSIAQTVEDSLVVVRAQLKGVVRPHKPISAWRIDAWPTQPQNVGKVLELSDEDEFPPDIVTTWGEDGQIVVVERFTTGIGITTYFVEDTPAGEQWATREVQGKLNTLDFSQNGGPTLVRISI